MSKKKIFIIICIVLLVFIGFFGFKFFSTTKTANVKISGVLLGNQIWSEEIIITGDTEIIGNLTVLPSTIVKFVVGDDRGMGDEVEKDGFNDNDPTRLKSYTKTHSSLFILGKLIAQGRKDKKIIFTSSAEKPYLADWEAIVWQGDGSIIDNVIVEFTRNGLNPIGKQPNSVIQNSISRHSMWGAISAANSNIKIINNILSDAGHEGIDLKSKGNQEVIGNVIDDCHTGIASMAGSQLIKNNTITNCGDGVYIDSKSSAISVGNIFASAPEDSKREWRYGNYVIPIFGYPK
ncbi:MAG: right-handed parallel beta-helix repeat-containing protein [Candidatus Roizmanbacteria bacterium]|nr:MAG: right-handed parallel beta-helix repeat-containing protein [Candidatus Roizmanbacteria bacterium]